MENFLGSLWWTCACVINSNQTAVHMNQISKMSTHKLIQYMCAPAVKTHISHFNITFLLIMPSRFQFSVSYADKCFTNKPLLNTICRHKSYIIFCISNLLDMTIVLYYSWWSGRGKFQIQPETRPQSPAFTNNHDNNNNKNIYCIQANCMNCTRQIITTITFCTCQRYTLLYKSVYVCYCV